MKIKKPTEMAKKLSEAKETRKDETVTVKTKTRILKKLRSKTGIPENISLTHWRTVISLQSGLAWAL